MASFLQNKPIEFTPYIPKYDVAMYGQIGMMKQGQYDQGVNAVQAGIDAVAGLPVGREIDKLYLQKKIQDVTSRANALGAADFSDKAIVSQLQTLAAGVHNDERVVAAVGAATARKKAIAEMDEARKAGKSSSVNEWFFQQQDNAWQNGTEAGESYTGRFKQFRDVDKKILEVIKAVDPSSTLTQMPYVTDANGQIKLDEHGSPIPSPAMMEKTYDGKTAKKLYDAIQASLDVDDIEQLRMNGTYAHRNDSPEALVGQIEKNFSKQKESLTDSKLHIAALLADPKLDDEDRAQYKRQLATVDQQLSKLPSQMQSYMQSAQSNPGAVWGQIYESDWMGNMANAFSSSKITQKIVDNPIWKANMEVTKHNFNVAKEESDVRFAAANLTLAQSKERREQEIHEIKKTSGAYSGDGSSDGSGGAGGGGYRTLAPLPTIDEAVPVMQQALASDLANAESTIAANENKVALEYLQSIEGNSGKSPQELINSIGGPAKIKQYAEGLLATYIEHPEKVPSGMRGYFDKIVQARQERDGYLAEMENVNKAGIAAGGTGFDEKKILGGLKPITLKVQSHQGFLGMGNFNRKEATVTISPRDQYDLATYLHIYPDKGDIEVINTDETAAMKTQALDAETRLKNKFGDNFDAVLANARGSNKRKVSAIPWQPIADFLDSSTTGSNEYESGGVGEGKKTTLNTNIRNISTQFKEANYLAATKAKEAYLRANRIMNRPITDGIPTAKPAQRDRIRSLVTAELSNAEKMDWANTDPNFKDNVDEIRKAAARNNTAFQVTVTPPELNNGEARYNLQITPGEGDDAGKTYSMDVTPETAMQMTQKPYNFNAPTIKNKINKNPNPANRSTNYQYSYTSPKAYSTAHLVPQNFPNVNPNLFNVRGDIIETSNGYQLVMYVKPKGEDEFRRVDVPTDFGPDEVEVVSRGVRTEDIINLMKK